MNALFTLPVVEELMTLVVGEIGAVLRSHLPHPTTFWTTRTSFMFWPPSLPLRNNLCASARGSFLLVLMLHLLVIGTLPHDHAQGVMHNEKRS